MRWPVVAGIALLLGLSVGGAVRVVALQPCMSSAYEQRLERLKLLESKLKQGILARRLGQEVGSEVAAALSETSDTLSALQPMPECLPSAYAMPLEEKFGQYQGQFRLWQQNYSSLETALGDIRGLASNLKELLDRPEAISDEDKPLVDVLSRSLVQASLDSNGVPRVRNLLTSLQARVLSVQTQQGNLGRLVSILQTLPTDGPISVNGRSALAGTQNLLPLTMQWISAQSRVEEAMRQLQSPPATSAQELAAIWQEAQAGLLWQYRGSASLLLLGIGLSGGLLVSRRLKYGRLPLRPSTPAFGEGAGGDAAGAGAANAFPSSGLAPNATSARNPAGTVPARAAASGPASAEAEPLRPVTGEVELGLLFDFLDHSHERAFIVDSAGRIQKVTAQGAALLGEPPEAVRQKELLPLLLPEMLHAEYKSYFQGTRTLSADGYRAEVALKSAGLTTRASRILLWRVGRGDPAQFLLVVHELNSRAVAEDLEARLRVNTLQLERSSLELRLVKARETAIREAAVDAIVGVDANGMVVDFNPAAESTFKIRAENARGQHLAAFIAIPGQTGEFLKGADGKISLARTFPARLRIEVTAMRGEGDYFPAELMMIEVPQNDTSLHYVFVRDITERKRVEQVKNEFISVVSHELRTPLTSIRGSLGLLEGGVMGTLSESALEMIRIARTNAERLIRLTSDMLDVEKMEAGRMALRVDQVPIGELLESAAAAVSGFASQAGVRVRIGGMQGGTRFGGPSPEEPRSPDASQIVTQRLPSREDLTQELEAAQLHQHIACDRDRLQQVLINLLSNAVKFSSPGQEVWLRVRRSSRPGQEPNWIRFEVQDWGAGIPLDMQDRLFKRFQQVDSNDGRSRRGTGLGLAISRAIVELHGGKIGLTSTPGQGSTFYFELPTQRQSGHGDVDA